MASGGVRSWVTLRLACGTYALLQKPGISLPASWAFPQNGRLGESRGRSDGDSFGGRPGPHRGSPPGEGAKVCEPGIL
ncbi:hypothetical protein B0T14DRAFT_226508 [Immersiella caudata]|uniref:Uncharacterized protein n=1 Tax=Immersiella caudata TaxID=314043 RepID=A0AA39WRL4_9PEZI|nr:hypothetical protein B0T14DRAFT_226508 [Immersiella caudata]